MKKKDKREAAKLEAAERRLESATRVRSREEYTHMLVSLAIGVCMSLQLSSQYTGLKAHEYIGFALIVLVVVHQFLNIGWYRALAKGPYSAERILLTVTNFLLIADMTLLLITGIAKAQYILPPDLLPIETETATKWHLFAGYSGFLLMGFHFGLHVADQLADAAVTGKGRLLLTVAFAVYSLYALHFGRYLTFQAHFAEYEEGLSPVVYAAELLSIWFLMSVVALAVKLLLSKLRKH